jgi:hypothetical protein
MKINIKFQIIVSDGETTNLEYSLEDLLKTSVLPALSAELAPLTLTITKARG